MKNIITSAIFLFLSSISIGQSFDDKKMDSLFLLLEQNDKFMGSLSVSQNGKEIYSKAIGYADIEKGIKANDLSKYRIGSISKMFTSALIFKAVDENKLKLDQSIYKYFPLVPNAKKITVGNLLNHRSGIQNFTDNEAYMSWNTKYHSKADMIKIVVAGGSDFEPNSKASYSNSNYVLLTFLLEEVFHTTYPKILNEFIIEPLGLENTYYGDQINTSNNECKSYKNLGSWTQDVETDMSIPLGAGAVVSNPKDINVFMEHLFLGKIISAASIKEMQTMNEGYGMGLFQYPYGDKHCFGHTGGIDAFQSMCGYFTDEKLALSITSNGVVYSNNNIMLAALACYFGDEVKLPNFSTVELTSEDLDKFIGSYKSEQIPIEISITKNENVLMAQATGQSAFSLDAKTENIFTFDPAGIEMIFDEEKKTLRLLQGGGDYLFNLK